MAAGNMHKKKFAKFGRAISEICEQTDKEPYILVTQYVSVTLVDKSFVNCILYAFPIYSIHWHRVPGAK